MSVPASQRTAIGDLLAGDDWKSLEADALRAAGASAARGTSATDPAVMAGFHRLAARDPLNSQPYLFAGAVADQAGDAARSARLYDIALRRSPRLEAAHYFVATRALRDGRIDEALERLSRLARLNPGAIDFDTAFAAYAVSTGNLGAVKRFLQREPARRDSLLLRLASDPANARAVVAIAGRIDPSVRPDPDWRARLMQGLVDAGRFEDARAAWRALTGQAIGSGIANPSFEPSAMPAPFNWTYRSGDAGLVEPGAGNLDLVYYGRSDGVLAEQLLLLPPGTYLLSMAAKGSGSPNAVGWSLDCAPDARPIMVLPLTEGRVAGRFAVPPNCPAQRLKLNGAAALSQGNSQWTLSGLDLKRMAP